MWASYIALARSQRETPWKRGGEWLGVCLGAQLIGEALGAKFAHSPYREIGVFEIRLTDLGKQDSLVGALPSRFNVGHWHGDMPGLTPDAIVLAVSDGCPRQIVRYGARIYGFQCHFEFTREAIDDLIAHSQNELERFAGKPYVEDPAHLRAHGYAQMNEHLFGFLDRLVAAPLQLK